MSSMDDIYEDIDLFPNIEEDYAKLQNANKQLTQQINVLENEVNRLNQELDKVKKVQITLEQNISSLFKTARLEIDRKTKVTEQLQAQIEELTKKHYESKWNNYRNKSRSPARKNQTNAYRNRSKSPFRYEPKRDRCSERDRRQRDYDRDRRKSPGKRNRSAERNSFSSKRSRRDNEANQEIKKDKKYESNSRDSVRDEYFEQKSTKKVDKPDKKLAIKNLINADQPDFNSVTKTANLSPVTSEKLEDCQLLKDISSQKSDDIMPIEVLPKDIIKTENVEIVKVPEEETSKLDLNSHINSELPLPTTNNVDVTSSTNSKSIELNECNKAAGDMEKAFTNGTLKSTMNTLDSSSCNQQNGTPVSPNKTVQRGKPRPKRRIGSIRVHD